MINPGNNAERFSKKFITFLPLLNVKDNSTCATGEFCTPDKVLLFSGNKTKSVMLATFTGELCTCINKSIEPTVLKIPSRIAEVDVTLGFTVTRFAAFCPTMTSGDLDENDVSSCRVMS